MSISSEHRRAQDMAVAVSGLKPDDKGPAGIGGEGFAGLREAMFLKKDRPNTFWQFPKLWCRVATMVPEGRLMRNAGRRQERH